MIWKNGAPGRIRTRDPLITNQVLYQLSYKGSGDADSILVAPVKQKSSDQTSFRPRDGRRPSNGAAGEACAGRRQTLESGRVALVQVLLCSVKRDCRGVGDIK